MEFKSTPTITVLAVLTDARPISTQCSGWKKAAETAVRWADEEFYTKDNPIIAVYLHGGGSGRAELHTIESLREDLKAGRVPGAMPEEFKGYKIGQKCPRGCGGVLKFYDGCLGYESLVCNGCKTDFGV